MTEEPQSTPDEPAEQPPEVESPTEGDHLQSPDSGHPAGDTEPPGGLQDRPHEHPEDIGDTEPDQDTTP
jgi:hypothetical protein